MSDNIENQLSPQERNLRLQVQCSAYLESLGRDPLPDTNQTISNAFLERQLAQLKAEYQASKKP